MLTVTWLLDLCYWKGDGRHNVKIPVEDVFVHTEDTACAVQPCEALVKQGETSGHPSHCAEFLSSGALLIQNPMVCACRHDLHKAGASKPRGISLPSGALG